MIVLFKSEAAVRRQCTPRRTGRIRQTHGAGNQPGRNRPRDALARFDLALRLSPRDPLAWSYQTLRAASLYFLGRYDEAIAAARDAMRTQLEDVVWPLVHWAGSLGQLGRSEEAVVVISELRRKRPGLTIAGFRAWPHNESRSVGSLEKMLDGLRKAGLPEAALASSHP